MEECPGPVLSFCRQPESEQEQFACGSSRGEQQFGSVWFHGWKHLQVRNPLFPPVYCVSPCYEWHTLAPPFLWDPLKFCPLLNPGLPWDPGFCEALPSVRPWLLWGFAFCEALPSVRPWLSLFYDTLPSVRPCLCLMGETLSPVKPCLSVRPCLPWCVRPWLLF